ncbi:nucleoside diphosphate-linked moiety X motif 17-like [Myxocyprinus asiaticus]|uniref:nucleoside diphosphate-linked moiety X motif 17-like n=1 Tax=Myxocyprinus asiaticus TaxID=70543 RepID=UPI002223831B|nr:nucleoside diphosphate-linked moiety X motif 17-like [Myxocyprinus asiaticus]
MTCLVKAVDGKEDSVQIPAERPKTASVKVVSPHVELIDTSLPFSLFCNRAPDHGKDIEQVSTRTKYALELWLKTVEPHAEMGYLLISRNASVYVRDHLCQRTQHPLLD